LLLLLAQWLSVVCGVLSITVHSTCVTEQVAALARRPPVRRPGLFAPVLLSVGTSVVLLLIIAGTESLARWCEPGYLVETRGFHVFSDTYGWAPRKGVSVVIDDKRVTFSTRGFRGRELSIPKAGDRTRVVVLGDSIAFGLHVSDEETFTHLLDVRNNGVEAANLAVQGYGPDQELLTLIGEGMRLDPDVVVVAFCLANDFAEAVLPVSLYDGKTPKPRFLLVDDRLVLDHDNLRRSAWLRVHQWLADYSHLFNRVSARVPWREPTLGPHWRERYDGAVGDEDYALRLNLALVRRMNAVCREREIRFLVAVFPDRLSYQVKPRLAERFLHSLETDGIQAIDMSVPFRAAGPRLKAVALDGTGHLNPFGHALAADVLEAYVRRPREARGPRQP
jgi:hypothetical protein